MFPGRDRGLASLSQHQHLNQPLSSWRLPFLQEIHFSCFQQPGPTICGPYSCPPFVSAEFALSNAPGSLEDPSQDSGECVLVKLPCSWVCVKKWETLNMGSFPFGFPVFQPEKEFPPKVHTLTPGNLYHFGGYPNFETAAFMGCFKIRSPPPTPTPRKSRITIILGVDSPFFSTIVLFKNQLFPWNFDGFLKIFEWNWTVALE